MNTKTKWLAAVCAAVGIFLFFACNKDNSSNSNANIPPGKSQLSVYMTDGPVNFYKVLIDIRQVAVEVDTGSAQGDDDHDDQWDDNFWGWHRDEDHKSVIWDTLTITPGVYDLLQLRNGTDTLLGSAVYPSGKILKVRVWLGSDNTIFTDSLTSYPLSVFGPHPYFDINVRKENVMNMSSNQFKLWLDFNLHRSIFFWSGTYYMIPYVIAFNDNSSGRIAGLVLPPGASPLIEAYNATDTVYAVPWWGGAYLMRGVNPGTYSILVKGNLGFIDTTLGNIVVNDGHTTVVPTVTLHQ